MAIHESLVPDEGVQRAGEEAGRLGSSYRVVWAEVEGLLALDSEVLHLLVVLSCAWERLAQLLFKSRTTYDNIDGLAHRGTDYRSLVCNIRL